MDNIIIIIIKWMNSNSGAVIGISTVVLVIVTGYYVYLTRRILEENRMMRLETHKPEIVVSLRPHEAHVHCAILCVENVGTGVAREVRFTGNLSARFDGETPLEEIGFLKNGIDTLGPGQKIEHFLVSVLENPHVLEQTPLEIGVTYKDSITPNHDRTFHLDFGAYKGTSEIGRSPLFEIAEATKHIEKHLHKLTIGSSKPIVLTEPLSKYHLRKDASVLEKRMAHLPDEAQQEIVQEVATIIKQKEQEVAKEDQNKKPITEYISDEIRGRINIEKEFVIYDEMVKVTESEYNQWGC